jgi:hypothetical protein
MNDTFADSIIELIWFSELNNKIFPTFNTAQCNRDVVSFLGGMNFVCK